MASMNLKCLGRAELLELLLVQTNEVERLQALLDEANELLNSRTLEVNKAGDLANAALQVNGVLGAAQNAAEQYLENVRTLSEQQETVCARMEAEAQARAAQMLAETTHRCEALENATVARCVEMVQTAQAQIDASWNDLASKISQFVDLHAGLREILQAPLQAPLSVDIEPPPKITPATDPGL